jgi:hypothetical protein
MFRVRPNPLRSRGHDEPREAAAQQAITIQTINWASDGIASPVFELRHTSLAECRESDIE